jgi:hypothetical protein
MPNSILTPTMITREALRILHQKLNFVGNVNRQYDNRFAQSGAKIGTSLNIRMPPRYKSRTGPTLAPQDHVERSTPLVVASQIGVDVSFTSVELTMSLDDFSSRVIQPAISQLAADIENQCLQQAYKLVANFTGTTSTQINYKQFQQNGALLSKQLAPSGDRCAWLTPDSTVEFNDAVKGLFQDSASVAKQYKEGMMGRTGGFDVYENTLIPSHTRGSLAGAALTTGTTLGISATTNVWASQTDVGIDGASAGTTLRAGDIITISGVFDVHPESKANLGTLKRFVVQNDVTLTTTANTYVATVKPALIYGSGNAFQNAVLSGVANTDNLTVTAFGIASTAYGQNIFAHKDAFVFSTVDLEDVSQYGAWGAREVMDGISMRVAKQYDITNDAVPCRIDVLYGFAGLYPELASRNFYALG